MKISNRDRTKRLVEFAVLLAMEVIIAFTPLGTIQVGPIAATLGHIPVIIAAIVLGTGAGAGMGFVFGLLSFLYWTFVQPANPSAIMFTPFCQFGDIHGSAWSLVICFVPRILIGVVAGETCSFVKRRTGKDGLAYGLAGALGSAVTTVLVLGLTYLLIGRTFMLANTGSAEQWFSILLALIGTTVLTNGLPELVLGAVVAVDVGYALMPRKTVLGVDIGASCTKLALCRGEKVLWTKRLPPNADLEAALKAADLGNLRHICVTGVGASYVEGDLCGIPTTREGEFRALARGATLISHKHNMVVASVGTGTSFVRVTPFFARHLGGSGVGGGMVEGMSKRLFGTFDHDALLAMAHAGDLANVDLLLADVCRGNLSNLDGSVTVANLYKADKADDASLALGIYNVVFQSIGVMAAFAVKSHMTRTVFLCGAILDSEPPAQEILQGVARLHKVKFIVPEQAAFVTAIGASLLHQ